MAIVPLNIGKTTVEIDDSLAERLRRASADMLAETGKTITPTSSYRTYAQQADLYQKLSPTGARVAPPGQSFHETGKAIDVANYQEAQQYLNRYGLRNDLSDDKGHFSVGETVKSLYPDFNQRVDLLRSKGFSDTAILDGLVTKRPDLAPNLQKARELYSTSKTVTNDRDLVNTLSVKWSGYTPKLPSVADTSPKPDVFQRFEQTIPGKVAAGFGDALNFAGDLSSKLANIDAWGPVVKALTGADVNLSPANVAKKIGKTAGGVLGQFFNETLGSAATLVGRTIGNIAHGNPMFEGVAEAIDKNMLRSPEAKKEGEDFWENVLGGGVEQAPLAIAMGPLGKLPNLVMAAPGAYETVKDISRGDYNKAIDVGVPTLFALHGAVTTKGLMVNPEFRAGVAEGIDHVIRGNKTPEEYTRKLQAKLKDTLGVRATDIKNWDIRKNKSIDTVTSDVVREGIPIGADSNGNIDTRAGQEIVSKTMDDLSQVSHGLLALEPTKQFSIEDVARKTKESILSSDRDAVTKQKMVEDIDYIKDAVIQANGKNPVFDGLSFDKEKSRLWKLGYDMGRPTQNKAARMLGHEMRQAILDAYPNSKHIAKVNEAYGRYADLKSFLENIHGRKPVGGGVLMKGLVRLTGAMVGHHVPFFGPIVGHWAGGKVADFFTDPVRNYALVSENAKKSGWQSDIHTQTVDAVKYLAEHFLQPEYLKVPQLTEGITKEPTVLKDNRPIQLPEPGVLAGQQNIRPGEITLSQAGAVPPAQNWLYDYYAKLNKPVEPTPSEIASLEQMPKPDLSKTDAVARGIAAEQKAIAKEDKMIAQGEKEAKINQLQMKLESLKFPSTELENNYQAFKAKAARSSDWLDSAMDYEALQAKKKFNENDLFSGLAGGDLTNDAALELFRNRYNKEKATQAALKKETAKEVKPKVDGSTKLYHATNKDFTEFKLPKKRNELGGARATFFSETPEGTKYYQYGDRKRIIESSLSKDAKIFDYKKDTKLIDEFVDATVEQNPKWNESLKRLLKDGNWGEIESESFQKFLKKKGYDGFRVMDMTGHEAIGITNLDKIKIIETPKPVEQPVTKAPTDLLTEAKKYKTAEEFVRAQGEPLYHGTSQDFKDFDIGKAGSSQRLDWGKGIYLTPDVKQADRYSIMAKENLGGEPKIINAFIDKNARMKDIYIGPSTQTNQTLGTELKADGYDGARIFTGTKGDADTFLDEIIIVNPDVIKTKSQLTDIWKQAHK